MSGEKLLNNGSDNILAKLPHQEEGRQAISGFNRKVRERKKENPQQNEHNTAWSAVINRIKSSAKKRATTNYCFAVVLQAVFFLWLDAIRW